jgi:crotonobetainyl-CoA:carnitine CoA-transferase CaiB-like acyl-CoA transferase
LNIREAMMLSCYTVLDLTNEKGFLCGKALGDLGAKVIKIEKPGGDPARNIGPFYHDLPDPEKSLYWFAFNANKKGITLDIETADGREVFKKLVKTADVVIESFAPGYMDKIGLGYPVLSQINPGIVLTSISGFGQKGPYKNYKDYDIAVWALSGYMYISGEPDRPPLMPSYSHGHLIGAMNGAVGTMVALCQRSFSGRGQQVDAATHQGLCFAISVETKVPWAMQKVITTRSGRERSSVAAKDGTLKIPLIWECKDGDVAFTFWLGGGFAKGNIALVDWIKESGVDPGILGRWNWEKDTWASCTVEDVRAIVRTLKEFVKKHTRMELSDGALDRRVQLTPILNPKDLLEFPQLVGRGFWRKIDHPDLNDQITYPGGFVKTGIGDCGIRFRAPLVGEHNEEIYKQVLGMTNEEMVVLKQRKII